MLESYSLRQTLRRFPIIRGGQCGTLTFFLNQLLTGKHLANSGEAQLKKNTLYLRYVSCDDDDVFDGYDGVLIGMIIMVCV